MAAAADAQLSHAADPARIAGYFRNFRIRATA
jgi:hypothetical protein